MIRLYVLAIFLFICSSSIAQNVTIAQDKIRKDGETVYVHNVHQKETLYSISKAYNIPIADIVRFNPQLERGLKTGMIIYIPDRLSGLKSNTDSKKQKRLSRQERIANALKKKKDSNEERELAENVVDYTKEEIPAQNEEIQDTTAIIEDSLAIIESLYPQARDNSVKIGMILPLNSRGSVNANFMDFYGGALIAVNRLSNEGVNIDLSMIDQNEYRNFDEIVNSGKLDDKEMVIGPVKSYELSKVLPLVERYKSVLVSPMDYTAQKLAATSYNFVQIPTSTEHQIESTLNFLRSEYEKTRSNVLVIYESGTNDTLYVNRTINYLTQNNIPFSKMHYSILQGRTIERTILDYIHSDQNNLVIVPSNKEAFISDVMRNLSLINSSERPIILFGMPKWKNFDILDIYQKHSLNLHLSVSYYVDETNPVSEQFINEYKSLYNVYPTPYAFQGYDIAIYMISNLWKDKNFILGNRMPSFHLIQSCFNFKRLDYNQGVINTGTRNIVYNKDYTISLID